MTPCVYTVTWAVISGCPIYWPSKLQTETATSTMEAEIIALGSWCCELLPIIALLDKIGVAVGIKKPNDDDPSSSTVTIHEDNLGTLILATTPPPQFTPCSKHYTIKTNWWHDKIIEKKNYTSSLSKCDFKRDISLPRCLLRSFLNSFGTCFKDGDNHCSRGSVEYD
jgi:hypothetical protein